MDKPLLYLGVFATVLGAMMLFVVIPAQHIPPMMSAVSPDFYPNIGTVILLVGGIGMLISGVRGKSAGVNAGNLVRTLRFCCLMAALFGITLITFKLFNFLVGGVVLVAVTMWLLGERRPLYLVPVSLLSPVLIWLLIDVLLGRSLP
jgi:heme/copper-type cytochrome/quinol oxidase subunit 3